MKSRDELAARRGAIPQGPQLDLALTWRHDSRAPRSLDQDNVDLRMGFTFRIR